MRHREPSEPIPKTVRDLRVGDWWIRPAESSLTREGEEARLRPRAMDVLLLLASRQGRTVTKQEILLEVWQNRAVEDGVLSHCISEIRSALGDTPREPRYIQTIPKRGYRMLAEVAEITDVSAAEGPPAPADRRVPGEGAETASADGRINVPEPGLRPGAVLLAWLGGAASLVLALVGWRILESPPDAEPAASGKEPARDAPRIVVLPFDYHGIDPEGVMLADGLATEVMTELVRNHGDRLAVIGRASAMRYRASPKSTAEIARELEVGWVLEGSLARDGEKIRVSARLVGADDVHRWANEYDRELRRESLGQLEVQARVADRIVKAVALNLGLINGARTEVLRSADSPALTQAHRQLLVGLGRLPPVLWSDLARAEEAFQRAVALDPSFADGWLGLALARYARVDPSDPATVEKLRIAVERALALDEGLPHAFRLRGLLLFYRDWDPEEARTSWERALELAPHLAEAHHDFAAYWSATGRHGEALASVGRAFALNPREPGVVSDLGWYAYFARRWQPAMERCRATLELEPGFIWAEECILLASFATGDLESARAQARSWLQALADQGALDAEAPVLAAVEAASPAEGLEAFLRWEVARLEQRWREGLGRDPSKIAIRHMLLGHGDQALEWLEEAAMHRAGWILPFLPVHPLFDPLRGEPRFREVVRRVSGESGLRLSDSEV